MRRGFAGRSRPVGEYFDELGAWIEGAWRRLDYAEATFPTIALRALAARPPQRHVSIATIVDYVQGDGRLPQQFNPTMSFGQPALTVYRTPRFVIDVLFWLDGTTSIHEHGFSGAFEVLAGSSIHSRYRFTADDEVTALFHLGRLELDDIELLTVGHRRRIDVGRRFIHSLFHLDRPSVTLVVRTASEPAAGAQFHYLKPAIGMASFVEDERTNLRLSTLTALRALDEGRFWKTWATAAAEMDVACFYASVARLAREDDLVGARFRAVLAAARRRHGPRIDHVLEVAAEVRRQEWLVRRRATVRDPEHRFFLALVLNAPNRDALLRLVGARHRRRRALDVVLDWLRALTTASSADEGPPLGFTLDEMERSILEHAVRGRGFAEILAALAREYDDVAAQEDDLRRLYEALRRHPLFSVLCAPPPSADVGRGRRRHAHVRRARR